MTVREAYGHISVLVFTLRAVRLQFADMFGHGILVSDFNSVIFGRNRNGADHPVNAVQASGRSVAPAFIDQHAIK